MSLLTCVHQGLTFATPLRTLICMAVSIFLALRWRFLAAALAVSGSLLATDLLAADKLGDKPSANYNIPLWEEGKVPLATGNGPLDSPFLTVFLPPEGKRNGGSVIIAPGGSNIMLMYGVEGIDVAERYNSWGVTAFVGNDQFPVQKSEAKLAAVR